MLLFDDSKKLEKAFGEEAAFALAHVLERTVDYLRQEFATKADLHSVRSDLRTELSAVRDELRTELYAVRDELRNELRSEVQSVRSDLQNLHKEFSARFAQTDKQIAETKHELLKWFLGVSVAQSALLISVVAFLK
jgi:vacuolar-type H+-ATPase subunit I/STV1